MPDERVEYHMREIKQFLDDGPDMIVGRCWTATGHGIPLPYKCLVMHPALLPVARLSTAM